MSAVLEDIEKGREKALETALEVPSSHCRTPWFQQKSLSPDGAFLGGQVRCDHVIRLAILSASLFDSLAGQQIMLISPYQIDPKYDANHRIARSEMG